MGAAKAAKATLENLSGVFQQLEREHGEVTALLLVVKATSDPAKRKELFPRIRAELLSHEKGELAEVYPAFREHANLANYAEIHEREARTLERTIEKLMAINYDDPNWGATFAELVNAVSHHVKEEDDGRQLDLQVDDNYFCRSAAVLTARARLPPGVPGGSRSSRSPDGHGRAGQVVEAKNGRRKDDGDRCGGRSNERAQRLRLETGAAAE
jgi:hypothetical protein